MDVVKEKAYDVWDLIRFREDMLAEKARQKNEVYRKRYPDEVLL